MNKWRKERNAALARLDMVWARELLPSASSDHVRLAAMHKARYECVDMTAEHRHESATWLREHNYSRFDGTPILPEGELPL